MSYELNLLNYKEHRNVGTYFKTYLFNTLVGIIFTEISIFGKRVIKESESEYFFKVEAYCEGHNLQYAWYIYRDGEIQEKIFYSNENFISYRFNEPAIYMVQYFVRSKEDPKIKNIGWFEETKID